MANNWKRKAGRPPHTPLGYGRVGLWIDTTPEWRETVRQAARQAHHTTTAAFVRGVLDREMRMMGLTVPDGKPTVPEWPEPPALPASEGNQP